MKEIIIIPKEFTEKQTQVYKILLCPIVCDLNIKCNPYKNGDNIFSGQTYKTRSSQTADPDMSDFAIGFYKIIYKEIFTNMLDDFGFLLNCCFAGDTMNSFNSIANITPRAGKSKKHRTPKDNWPEDLQNYKTIYHCLANFWILPMCLGRTSMKLNRFDSMDIFLSILETDYDIIISKHKDYISKFSNLNNFANIHFLNAYFPLNRIKYCEQNSYKLIQQATKRIKERAKSIAQSPYSDELWDYFNSLSMFDK